LYKFSGSISALRHLYLLRVSDKDFFSRSPEGIESCPRLEEPLDEVNSLDGARTSLSFVVREELIRKDSEIRKGQRKNSHIPYHIPMQKRKS